MSRSLQVVLDRNDRDAHVALVAENLRWAARAEADAEDATLVAEICGTRAAFAVVHFLQAFARPEVAR